MVSSNAKLFSGASTEFGGDPNSHVSLVDAAMQRASRTVSLLLERAGVNMLDGVHCRDDVPNCRFFGQLWQRLA